MSAFALKNRKLVYLGGLGLVVLILFMLLLQQYHRSIGERKEVWGRVEAKEIDINSKIPGRVIALLVKEGDMVQQGQLLAVIDNRDIVAQIEQSQAGTEALDAQLAQANTITVLDDQTVQANLMTAKAALEKAKADLSLAESEGKRFQQLFNEDAVSQQTRDSYQSRYAAMRTAKIQAEAELKMAEANLLKHQSNRDNAQNLRSKIVQTEAMTKQLEVALDETKIVAPFTGIITTKYVEQGSMISSGTPLLSLQDPLDNWVNIKVAETDLGKYRLGQILTLQGRDKKTNVSGKITDISKKAEYATYRATSERGEQDIITFNVKIQIASPLLRPGMRFCLLKQGN